MVSENRINLLQNCIKIKNKFGGLTAVTQFIERTVTNGDPNDNCVKRNNKCEKVIVNSRKVKL